MPDIRFDTFYRYDDLTRILKAYADEYPQLVQVTSIGKSYEGRDIWLATVTNTETGPAEEKPAFWVDGNIHATELSPSTACLYLLNRLVTAYGDDADVTRALDTRAFYVCPRVNPDGAEWALADKPRYIRSSTRPYPYDEEPLGGLVTEDIDGDGRMLTMRIPDPNGAWKVCPEEPRLMVLRDPTQPAASSGEPTGGQYYRPAARRPVQDWHDGVTIAIQPKKERLDLNRNFPEHGGKKSRQRGAGPYPASEPEVHAMVQFIASHPNITGGVAFHTYSGVLCAPTTTRRQRIPRGRPVDVPEDRRKGHRNHRLPQRLRLPRLPLSPQGDHHRRVRHVALRTHGRFRLDGGDLESAAPGWHRGLQVHRLVARASAGRRSQAAQVERRSLERKRLRRMVSFEHPQLGDSGWAGGTTFTSQSPAAVVGEKSALTPTGYSGNA